MNILAGLTISFFICIAVAEQAESAAADKQHECPDEASIPTGSAMLQKEQRLWTLRMQSATTSTVTEPPVMEALNKGHSPNHALVFVLILVIGAILNSQGYLLWSLTLSKEKLLESHSLQDSIHGTESSTGAVLTENTDLLVPESVPTASSFLELLPNIDSVALCRDGLDTEGVTYAQLHMQLRDPNLAASIGGERVALVLDNGKEMAVCMLAVMNVACAVPLNPAFTREELAASMEQLQCTSVILRPGKAGEAACQAATDCGLQIFVLNWTGSSQDGKLFSLQVQGLGRLARRAEPSQEVLMLKTSGTTSKGKVVTFTLERLSRAARYNARSVELGAGSVCLSMMPLYHIAGISVNFLASISAGATVLFFSGLFDVKRFVAELERTDSFKPTWYFAVPAVHEAVLAHAAELCRPLEHRLHLIRSAGAALPQQTGLRLIETFKCAVTPAYGMTEALEITCPSADYQLQKPGSVGPSICAQIKILNGEVCVAGDLVMPGYEYHGPQEEDPNREAWTGGSAGKGFLRTGDLGHMDKDGWLFLTGRCKEMINRGGETINPHEVEPAIASMPEIDVVVCFAAPHHALGECVAAAVVLQKDASPEKVPPKAILQHCASRASATMQPEVFVYLPREVLPTTATKKFIRAGLAQKLGLTSKMAHSKAFVYNESKACLEASNTLESETAKLTDSLGQLREVSSHEYAEQQIKDGMYGLAILQVVVKHWYEGHYTGDVFHSILYSYDLFSSAYLVFMCLFFTLAGHSASQVQTRGEFFKRWLGFYALMTFTSIIALATTSQRVDWFFAVLIMLEIITVSLNTICSKITAVSFVGLLPIIGFLTLAAAFSSQNALHTESIVNFYDLIGWDSSINGPGLVGSWTNIFLGNIDRSFGGWKGGAVFFWAASFAVGFHFLPKLSQLCRSHDQLMSIMSYQSVRLLASLGVIFLLAKRPLWPEEDDNVGWEWFGTRRGTNKNEFLLELIASMLCLIHGMVTLTCIAIAIGPNASVFKTLGKSAIGALVTHTAFSKFEKCSFNLEMVWPLHDVLQFDILYEYQPELVPFALVIIPILYVLVFGKWVQTAAVDKLLQYPILAFPMWAAYLLCHQSSVSGCGIL